MAEDQLKQIAARLRELRELRDFTGDEAARKLAVDPDLYHRYESGAEDIPISLLHDAADLFQVDVTELLTGKAPKLRSYCLVKAGEGVKVDRYQGYNFQSLAYNFIHRSAEPLLVTVNAGHRPELVTHPGQEFNFCLEGTIIVTVGDHELTLNPGDSLYFDPNLPHGQRAQGGEAKFLTIIL